MKRIGQWMKYVWKWLENHNAFNGLVTTVIAVILVPFVLWGVEVIRDHFDHIDERICIDVPKDLVDYSFFIRYVREEGAHDNTTEGPFFIDDVPLTYDVTNSDQSQKKCSTIPVKRHYGLHFKPFVDLAGKPLLQHPEQVRDYLQAAGYDLSYDKKPDSDNHLFFLLPTKDKRYQQVPDYRATAVLKALQDGKSPDIIHNDFIIAK